MRPTHGAGRGPALIGGGQIAGAETGMDKRATDTQGAATRPARHTCARNRLLITGYDTGPWSIIQASNAAYLLLNLVKRPNTPQKTTPRPKPSTFSLSAPTSVCLQAIHGKQGSHLLITPKAKSLCCRIPAAETGCTRRHKMHNARQRETTPPLRA